MKLHESGENYLETIYLLQKQSECVRAIDIATELSFSRASVSRALNLLKNKGYIDIENNQITLTKQGQEKAESIYARHVHITNFLVESLGIDRHTAEKDACRIEHIISEKTFNLIKEKY